MEKWYIKVTRENRKLLHEWRIEQPKYREDYCGGMDCTKDCVCSEPLDGTYLDYNEDAINAKNLGCVEINTEQFIEEVLKNPLTYSIY